MSHLPGGGTPPPPPPPPGPAGPGRPSGDPAWPAGRAPDGARPEDAFRVPFSIADGAIVVFWTLFAQILVVVPALLMGIVDLEGGDPTVLLLVITAQAVGLAGALAWLSLRGRLSWRLLGPARPRGVHLLFGIGVGVGGYLGVTVLLLALLEVVGPVEPPEQQLLTEAAVGGMTTVLAVVAAVVMAPIVEEVVFRGVLFQALKRRTGLWPATLLSALLFAVVHVEVTQPVYSGALFVLGVLFALTLHRTGSLVVPMLGHAVFNLIMVSLAIAAA